MAALRFGTKAALPAIVVVGSLVAPRSTLHAEAPSDIRLSSRKPIYDDEIPIRNTAPLPSRPKEPEIIKELERGPTAELAGWVRRARLFTAAHVRLVEDKFNAGAQRFFDVEERVTSTIAGLAPDERTTGERIMPGVLYVAVAGMAGQIITRRRNILLRASVPVLFAVVAANRLLPHTSDNVANLLWSWEKKFPVVADNHLRARAAVNQAVDQAAAATHDARAKLDEAVKRSREALEGWVRKGQ